MLVMGWFVPIVLLCFAGRGHTTGYYNKHPFAAPPHPGIHPSGYSANHPHPSHHHPGKFPRIGYNNFLPIGHYVHYVSRGGGGGPAKAPSKINLNPLFRRAQAILTQMRAFTDQVQALNAGLTSQTRAAQQLTQSTFPAISATDDRQTADINTLQQEMYKIQSGVNDDLDLLAMELRTKNDLVLEHQRQAGVNLNTLRVTNTQQDGQIAELGVKVNALLKPMTRMAITNAFDLMDQQGAKVNSQLTTVATADKQALCENGRVTLDADDRRAELQFQRPFTMMPRVTASLCGFSLRLNSPQQDGGDSQDDPGTGASSALQGDVIGTRITAQATRSGVTLEMFDLSVGDPKAATVDVCFQACTDM